MRSLVARGVCPSRITPTSPILLRPPPGKKRLFVFSFGRRSYFLQIWGRLYFLSVFSHQLYFLWFEQGLVVFFGNILRISCFLSCISGEFCSFFHEPANQTNSPTNRHAPATRTISGDSDGDDGASSGFLLALRRIRIRSGGVLLSSHRAPSHPPLNVS